MRSSLIAFLMSTTAVFGADVALVIGNEDYAHGRDIAAADEMLDAATALGEAGFEVSSGEDMSAADMQALVTQFAAKADGTGRVVIALAGQFASVGGQGVFLGIDADAPGMGELMASGLSLPLLAEIAARAPGGAVMVLGSEDRDFDLGEGVTHAVSVPRAPQGVTIVSGAADDMADFATVALPQRGITLPRMLVDWPEAEAKGFLSELVPFRTAAGGAIVAPEPIDKDAEQRAFWRTTQSIGTKEAYETYVERYPNGLFVAEARTELDRIASEPERQAEAAEADLKLSRDDRRQIQRNLSLLEFDPRGIDGIFGPGSRAAITRWQQVNGERATGYVTRDQVVRLQAQADKRAAELEAEAAARQAELERQDRAYWEATGQLGDEAGLRAYLERYPDGVFAEVAQARLEPFEAARREQAAAQDRADWDAAVSVDTEAAYRGYLEANPEGAFVEDANARVSELEFARENAAALDAAERNEARLGLNQSTRRLVEDRLGALGLKPGEVDGNFDDATRRAIRRYQEARNLQRTGYLNQATLVRLLADSVLR